MKRKPAGHGAGPPRPSRQGNLPPAAAMGPAAPPPAPAPKGAGTGRTLGPPQAVAWPVRDPSVLELHSPPSNRIPSFPPGPL